MTAHPRFLATEPRWSEWPDSELHMDSYEFPEFGESDGIVACFDHQWAADERGEYRNAFLKGLRVRRDHGRFDYIGIDQVIKAIGLTRCAKIEEAQEETLCL